MTDNLPVLDLVVQPESAEFWAATARNVLLLKRCDSCSAVIWYPRAFCPECGSQRTSWFESSGRGTVYAYTVVRKSVGVFTNAVPYILAYVELAEGPRLLTNLVECDPRDVSIGQAVTVTFQKISPERSLYRFRPSI
jgi:hypothetical protein